MELSYTKETVESNNLAVYGKFSRESEGKSSDLFASLLANFKSKITTKDTDTDTTASISKNSADSLVQKSKANNKDTTVSHKKDSNTASSRDVSDDDDEDKKDKKDKKVDNPYVMSAFVTDIHLQDKDVTSSQSMPTESTDTQDLVPQNLKAQNKSLTLKTSDLNLDGATKTNLMVTDKALDSKSVNAFAGLYDETLADSDLNLDTYGIKESLDKLARESNVSQVKVEVITEDKGATKDSDVLSTLNSKRDIISALQNAKNVIFATNDENTSQDEASLNSETLELDTELQSSKSGTEHKSKAAHVSASANASTNTSLSHAINTLKSTIKKDEGLLSDRRSASSLESMIKGLNSTGKSVLEIATGQGGKNLQNSFTEGQSFAQTMAQNEMYLENDTKLTKSARGSNTFKLDLSYSAAKNAKEILQKVNEMAARNLKTMTIDLNPKSLGRMQIKIGISDDNEATQVAIAASSTQTKEILEMSLGKLRESLGQNVDVANEIYDLETSSQDGKGSDDNSSFAQNGQERQDSHQDRGAKTLVASDILLDAKAEDESAIAVDTLQSGDLTHNMEAQGLNLFA